MKLSDVIVIGGGIAGISAAAEIAASARVAVLEQEDQPGFHASGRSAAIFLKNYGNDTLRALNREAEPFLEAPEGVSDTSLLSPRGELSLASGDETDALERYVSEAEGVERLSPAEAAGLVPILNQERIAAAAHEPGARDIDVDRMLQGFARLLRARGGSVETGAPVRAVRRRGGNWTVETARDSYEAPIVINAAGAWADPVARMAGVAPKGLVPFRRSAAILPAPEGRDVARWPLFGSVSETWYAKPEAGKLMVSPAEEEPVEPHDAWADDMVLAEGLHRYEQAVRVPVSRVEHSWAGLRTFAPDRTPVAGFDPEAEGFFWLAGQGGYGMQTAPALARLAAALVLGRDPALDHRIIAALSPARFTTNAKGN